MWRKTRVLIYMLVSMAAMGIYSPQPGEQKASLAGLHEIEEIQWQYQRISGTLRVEDTIAFMQTVETLAADIGFIIDCLEEKEEYIMMNLLLPPEGDGLAVKNLLQEITKADQQTNLIYVEMVGGTKGQLSLAERQRLAGVIYERAAGQIYFGNEETGLFSVHGYSKALGKFLMVGGEPVNLSLAVAYNDASKETVFYLGIPLVKENY